MGHQTQQRPTISVHDMGDKNPTSFITRPSPKGAEIFTTHHMLEAQKISSTNGPKGAQEGAHAT